MLTWSLAGSLRHFRRRSPSPIACIASAPTSTCAKLASIPAPTSPDRYTGFVVWNTRCLALLDRPRRIMIRAIACSFLSCPRGHTPPINVRRCGCRRLRGNPPKGGSSTAFRPSGCLRLRPPRSRARRRGIGLRRVNERTTTHGYHRISDKARRRPLRG